LKTVVVTGPESTGKTLISEYLSGQLSCEWIPEYAREYIGSLGRQYRYDDLVHIAETQIRQRNEAEQNGTSLLVLDTWLIITKVWFSEVFGTCPEFVLRAISEYKPDLFLVCMPDIPWVPDPLRENGGEKREYLLNSYIKEIKKTGVSYLKISGTGEERYRSALEGVRSHFKL
jgi:NadR type nicotinamide-nucleotide adenylyltransferase